MHGASTRPDRRNPPRLIVIVALLGALLAACSLPPPPPTTPEMSPTGAPNTSKATFLLRLIGICAGVNNFVAQETRKNAQGPPSGAVADRLERLIGAAMANAPNVDEAAFKAMVARLRALVQALRAAQQVDPVDERKAAASKEDVALAMKEADKAAVTYGMPHLDQCNAAMQPWKRLPDMPVALQQAGMAVVDGRPWVVGGLTDSGGEPRASTKVLYYDPVLKSWDEGTPLPRPLHHVMAVNYGGELVVIGGWSPADGDIKATTSVEVLKLAGDRWTHLANLNHPRAAGAAAVAGRRIVVTGGLDGDHLVATTEVFDGKRWHDAAALPVPGDHLGAISAGGFVYAIGGRDHVASKSTAAVQRYDPGKDRWSQMAPLPAPRGGLGTAYHQGTIYAVGGETASSAQAVVTSYDIRTNRWTTMSSLLERRHGVGVAVGGSTLYAVGGGSRAGHENSTDTAQALDLSGASAPPKPSAANVTTCPVQGDADYRACLTSARANADGTLSVRYQLNFQPSHLMDPGHHHLHVYTARPDGKGGTIPAASTMQATAGDRRGSWASVYARHRAVIDPRATSGKQRPLNTSAPLLCVRAASGLHTLAKDSSGGYRTGNCVTIRH